MSFSTSARGCSNPKGPTRLGPRRVWNRPNTRRSTLPFFFRPPPGDAYAHVEASKGELGFYLVSDGGIAPYRCKIRSPSFINLTVLAEMLIGWKVADLMVIFGSLDVNMGEVDR